MSAPILLLKLYLFHYFMFHPLTAGNEIGCVIIIFCFVAVKLQAELSAYGTFVNVKVVAYVEYFNKLASIVKHTFFLGGYRKGDGSLS
jgi:hypothetical protein